jgi:hypothetical protein
MQSVYLHEPKQNGKFSVSCPVCHQAIRFGVERSILDNATKFPISHIILHGVPLHALIVYIDANFMVRGEEGCESIEVLQKSETLGQLIKKWSNPF